MADQAAQADIRGMDIEKAIKGFADEENVLKQYLNVTSTKNREIRWFQKTAGFLDSTDTTGITASQIANTSSKSRPVVVGPSFTRNTSYVRKYMVESEWLSDEDVRDTDVDLLATTIRDLVRAVARQVDARIYTELSTGTGVQTGASTQDGWDDTATGNPILDLATIRQAFRAYGYKPEGAILAMNSIEEKNLINYLISVKGSSIPSFASMKVATAEVTEIMGFKVIVADHYTTDQVLAFVPNCATWKTFSPLQSAIIIEPLIGKKVRISEEGEILLTDPKACYLLTDTVT